MNMWGFSTEIFDVLEHGFAEFLGNLADPMKGEYLIPTVVDQLIPAAAGRMLPCWNLKINGSVLLTKRTSRW